MERFMSHTDDRLGARLITSEAPPSSEPIFPRICGGHGYTILFIITVSLVLATFKAKSTFTKDIANNRTFADAAHDDLAALGVYFTLSAAASSTTILLLIVLLGAIKRNTAVTNICHRFSDKLTLFFPASRKDRLRESYSKICCMLINILAITIYISSWATYPDSNKAKCPDDAPSASIKCETSKEQGSLNFLILIALIGMSFLTLPLLWHLTCGAHQNSREHAKGDTKPGASAVANRRRNALTKVTYITLASNSDSDSDAKDEDDEAMEQGAYRVAPAF